MRQYLIERIIHFLLCNGGGTPAEKMNLNTSRFISVYEYYLDLLVTDHVYPRKYKEPLVLSVDDLEKLGDEQLVDLFSYVVRRSSVCM